MINPTGCSAVGGDVKRKDVILIDDQEGRNKISTDRVLKQKGPDRLCS